MIIVRIMSLIFCIFAAYIIIDLIIPAALNKPMFTVWKYIFTGVDDEDSKTKN
jgi:hypothetical protein